MGVRSQLEPVGKTIRISYYEAFQGFIDTHQVLDLIHGATAGGIRDRPGRLFPRLEVRLRQQVDNAREDVGVDDGLDLLPIAGGYIRDGPAGLLPDGFLRRTEQLQDTR